MARGADAVSALASRVPHACGDGPTWCSPCAPSPTSSPRLWGWPAEIKRRVMYRWEFPTPVGMARTVTMTQKQMIRVPHACGDGPRPQSTPRPGALSSPRLWGWPAAAVINTLRYDEFPTPVGMARQGRVPNANTTRVPHACGDGPATGSWMTAHERSSPRLWGWPGRPIEYKFCDTEFPTPVGMARWPSSGASQPLGVPHACGDGPDTPRSARRSLMSSPRLWGWPGRIHLIALFSIEFPTPVGMARLTRAGTRSGSGVPHACGDGPQSCPCPTCAAESSPRLWGWPGLEAGGGEGRAEFPTPVGMARKNRYQSDGKGRVPHACGDGPSGPCPASGPATSSPRLWGWPATERGWGD